MIYFDKDEISSTFLWLARPRWWNPYWILFFLTITTIMLNITKIKYTLSTIDDLLDIVDENKGMRWSRRQRDWIELKDKNHILPY